MIRDLDAAVRLRAFEFLTEQRRRFGDASIPRGALERGFDFENVRVPLIGPQGIFKPAILPEVPLTITTAPSVERRDRPYDDGFEDGGFLRYRYRGSDPGHRDNVGLRLAMHRQTPLIYLHGIIPGLYEAAWPVFVVDDRPATLTFILAIDDQVGTPTAWQVNDPAALTARRQYVTAVVRQRLHQRGFRERVLRAYRHCCAICRLRHDELEEIDTRPGVADAQFAKVQQRVLSVLFGSPGLELLRRRGDRVGPLRYGRRSARAGRPRGSLCGPVRSAWQARQALRIFRA